MVRWHGQSTCNEAGYCQWVAIQVYSASAASSVNTAHLPASQGEQALGLCLLWGKGRVKRMATCCLHGPDLPHLSTPSSPPGADSQILQLCAGCQSKLLYGKSTHHWNWSHGHPKKPVYDVTDIVTLLDTVDPAGFKWGRSLTHSSSKPTTSEPMLTETKSCSIVMLLESSVPHSLQQITVVPRFARCWSAPFMQNRWLWQCQWKLWLLCKAAADALGGCLRQLVLMCKPAKGSRSAKMAGWPNTA